MNPLALQVLVAISHVPERSLGPSLLDWNRPSIPPLPKIVHTSTERDAPHASSDSTSRK